MGSAGTKALLKTLFPAGAAGAALGMPEDAEAAKKVSPAIKAIVKQLEDRTPLGGSLGNVQDYISGTVSSREPAFQIPEYIMQGHDVEHLFDSRMVKPKPSKRMSPEEIGDMLNSLITSTRGKVVRTKDKHPVGVIVPHGDKTYLGVLRPDEGRYGIHTAYFSKTEKLPGRLGSFSKDGVGAKPPYIQATDRADGSIPQRGLPAVRTLQENSTPKQDGVKTLLKSLLGAGGATAATAPMSEAEAAIMARDLPLETPYLDPVSMFASGFGVGGVAGKLAAAGADALLGLLLEGMNAPRAPQQPWTAQNGD